jgi:hypothetical protein
MAQNARLQQGFEIGGMGFWISLHGSNPQPLMSALGQKETSADVCVMSALRAKADIGSRPCDVCFVPKADIAKGLRGHDPNPSSRVLASLKSRVSKPSVNQPQTDARTLRASSRLP